MITKYYFVTAEKDFQYLMFQQNFDKEQLGRKFEHFKNLSKEIS